MTGHDDSSEANEPGTSITSDAHGLVESDKLRSAASAQGKAEAATELREAMDVLEQAVQKLLDRHKQPRAAGVKSEMQLIISGTFNQADYGYGSFRAFVEDAANKGVVELIEPSRAGEDALITLPGKSVPAPPIAVRTHRRGRIRKDIWRAFTSWETGYTRLWDLETNQALMFPSDPRPLEPSQHQLWRDLAQAEPERFRTISVITENELTNHMRSFVAALDPGDDAVQILIAALEQSRPARSFTAAARSLPGIAEKWKQDRSDFVWDWINTWRAENGVQASVATLTAPQDDNHQNKRRTDLLATRADRSIREPDSERTDDAVDSIRQRIFAALARMPTSELLRIRVPVEYLIDR